MKREASHTIKKEFAGLKLIEYMAMRFTYYSREDWERIIIDNSLTINLKPVTCDYLVELNDLVTFSFPEIEEPKVNSNIIVLYEDNDYIIVNKPPLLPCHPSGIYFNNTLLHILQRTYNYEKLHIITRLDRETSGLVLIGKNTEAVRYAQELQKVNKLEKLYKVIVHGDFPLELCAEGFLTNDPKSLVRKKRTFIPKDKELVLKELESYAKSNIKIVTESCKTIFRLVHRFENLSLVEAHLFTGRTHQIRASLYSLGYPVLGDKLYGLNEKYFLRFIDDTLTNEDTQSLILPYQALHCEGLRFIKQDGDKLTLTCPPPWPQTGLLSNLDK